jgi:5-(carboxyamino)imidazole ribonucleotide mutase
VKVAVLMGSANDAEKIVAARETLERFGVEHEVWAMSAHRNAEAVREFVGNARENGFGVIIAAAGMAAHLAGACAANTTLPVIGIPVSGGALDGVDALYSTVQMPPGMPVATVAVNGAQNAALLAIQILAVTDEGLAKKLADARAEWKPKQL